MDLEFTADQDELRDSVRAVLERECPVSLCREVVETGQGGDALVRTMAGLDWFGLSVPEEAGGMGLGMAEVAVVVEELGRRLAPGPFLSTVTQFVPAVALAGTGDQQRALLGPVAAGEAAGALALADHPRRWRPADVTATARPVDGGWALAGEKRAVLAEPGHHLVVAAREPGGGMGLFVVDGQEVAGRPVQSLDRSRALLDVTLDGVVVPAERVLGDPGSPEVADALERTVEVAALGVALEVLGTSAALLDLIVEYVKVRHQFGVPIGTFQAVKHKMADCYVAVQRARALALFAVAAVEEADPRRALAVHMAKAAADDCQRRVGQDAVQSFGGIGFTWEHDAHLFVKRAMATSALFGGAPDHRLAIAGLLGVSA